MTKRKDAADSAARAERRPCAICGRFALFHLLRRQDRLEIDVHDDGHVFRPLKGSAKQMRLPFDVISITRESAAKMPCRKAVEVAADRPSQSSAKKSGRKAG